MDQGFSPERVRTSGGWRGWREGMGGFPDIAGRCLRRRVLRTAAGFRPPFHAVFPRYGKDPVLSRMDFPPSRHSPPGSRAKRSSRNGGVPAGGCHPSVPPAPLPGMRARLSAVAQAAQRKEGLPPPARQPEPFPVAARQPEGAALFRPLFFANGQEWQTGVSHSPQPVAYPKIALSVGLGRRAALAFSSSGR